MIWSIIRYFTKTFYSFKSFYSEFSYIKTSSKRAIQKTAEGTGDLTGYKIAKRITKISKTITNSKTVANEHDKEIRKERHISSGKRQEIIIKIKIIKIKTIIW